MAQACATSAARENSPIRLSHFVSSAPKENGALPPTSRQTQPAPRAQKRHTRRRAAWVLKKDASRVRREDSQRRRARMPLTRASLATLGATQRTLAW